jgi:hypothetical protein
MELLSKHIFETFDLSFPVNGVYRALRRINRETETQYISDVQRIFPRPTFTEPGIRYIWFQKIARRYFKNKLINPETKTFTDYYGEIHLVDDTSFQPMISDTSFNNMFNIVGVNTYIDRETHIAKTLKKTFGLEIYYASSMYNEMWRGHYDYNYDKTSVYDRNAIFYQITNSGEDKKVITPEENQNNSPILMWVFEDRIVYIKAIGRNEH